MNTCPKCGSQERQNRDGVTGVGSQRYKCMKCGCKYTPVQKARGYDLETRKKAIQMYVDGMNLRRIGRHLGLHHRTVSLWVAAICQRDQPGTNSERGRNSGVGRAVHFYRGGKKQIHIVTKVDRRTRCFIGCNVVWERDLVNMQQVVDQSPTAGMCHSDAFATYNLLAYYPRRYTVSEGKTDTYSVEGDNAELHHYLARLARKSRCFSRCPYALCYALILFIFAFNSRQLYKQQYPNYPAHVFQFATP